MKTATTIGIISAGLLAIIFCGCKKDWLDAKPTKNLVVPSSIADYQALLDNVDNGNGAAFNDHQSTIDEVAVGDFYLTDQSYDLKSAVEKAAYIWADDTYAGTLSSSEWDYPYRKIFYTNIILEGIEKVNPQTESEKQEWNKVKGSALFFRAYNHYNIAQLFCNTYESSTANTDLGIPLRVESDINISVVRSTVQETYDHILADLKNALALISTLGPVIGDYKTQTRPNKAAVLAMLGRVYLSMSKYDSAFTYADKSLKIYDQLMDFNTSDVESSGNFRVPGFNKETLFYQQGNVWGSFGATAHVVDSNFMSLFSNDDLRDLVFFREFNGSKRYFGEYTQFNGLFFTGLATDEVYLIRAECHARLGNVSESLKNLNSLWKKRWNNAAGVFPEITATDANDALRKVLVERRKELCFRGLRWSDLRRLNKEPQFAETLKRTVHGQNYSLPPNSPLYIFPIPHNVVRLSGISQNAR